MSTPSPDPVQLNIRRETPPPPPRTVTYNGQKYQVVALKGSSDITSQLTDELLQKACGKANDFFRRSTNRQFESANMFLEGESQALTARNLDTEKVRIVGMPKFTYKEGGQTIESNLEAVSETEHVALDRLEDLGSAYTESARVSNAAPAAPAAPPAPPEPQYETVDVDDRLKICEGRAHNVVGAPVALAGAPPPPPPPPPPRPAAPPPAAPPPAAPPPAVLPPGGALPPSPPAPLPGPGAPPPPGPAPAAPTGRPPRRPVGNPHAYYALADQLSKMPAFGYSAWNALPVNTIVNNLKAEIPDRIKTKLNDQAHKQEWIASNIEDISGSLNSARLFDRQKLVEALAKFNHKYRAELQRAQLPHGYSEASFDATFTTNFSTWSPQVKETMVKIYLEYISDVDAKFVGSTFFKTFVEIHQERATQDFFQVVLIQENEDGTQKATSFPDGNIETIRCAFIHIDAQGKYSSYDRAADGAKKLTNLNNRTPLIANLRTMQKLRDSAVAPTPAAPAEAIAPPSSIKTLNIDSAGRCLDMSIAYQMIRQQYPKMSDKDILESENLVDLANELREQAAELILSGDDNDYEFFIALRSSILDIPAFADPFDTRYSDDQRNSSYESISRLKYPEAEMDITDINRILNEKSIGGMTKDEKMRLKRFYSNYIKQSPVPIQSGKGKYFNYLDTLFLKKLPEIQITGYSSIKYAIIENDNIQETYEGVANTEINTKDWIFLEYKGRNHYEAVNLVDRKTEKKVSTLIQIEKERELRRFLEKLPTDDPDTVKMKLTTVIKNKYPEAYNAFCRLTWKFAHDNWKKNPSPIEEKELEPGLLEFEIKHEEGITIKSKTGAVLDVEAYGDSVLTNADNSVTPSDLKNILLSFKKVDINNAMKRIPPI